jgi:hypothetical protein
MGYRYDPSRKALLTPARDTTFFRAGRPASEAVLCAEMSRLAYAAFERDSRAKVEVEANLKRIGFAVCTFFSTESTQAFLAHDPTTPLSVLAFRGTELDPRDWATDLNASLIPGPTAGQVHRGFAEALEAAWAPITAVLGSVTGRLLCTGHSLGAALATLAAARHSPHALYTYGCPRVGDAGFAEATASLNHHRYSHCCDLVCRVPPEALGYLHTGPLAYLDRRGTVHRLPSDQFVQADQKRARLGYLRHWSWRVGTMWTRDTADHAPINYVAALTRTETAAP